jgi:methyl-accepting chemotaxis protein
MSTNNDTGTQPGAFANVSSRHAGTPWLRQIQQMKYRRTYLVDPEAQLNLARQFIFVTSIGACLGVANVYVIRDLMAVETYTLLENAILCGYGLILVAISLGLVCLLCVFLSHRTAGPAVKIGETLMKMADGDLWTKIRLRDTDLLQDVAQGVNATSRNFRQTVVDIRRELEQMQPAVRGNPALERRVAHIQKLLRKYRVDAY